MVQFRTGRNGTSCGENWKFFHLFKIGQSQTNSCNQIEMKFVFRGIFSASLLMVTIESFGYTKDAEVKSWNSVNWTI